MIVIPIIASDPDVESVGGLDQLRRRLLRSLADFHPRLTVDAIVTADASYAAGALQPE